MQFVNLSRQMDLYKQEFQRVIDQVLQSGQYVQGKQIASLEDDLSQYVDVSHTMVCSSGTMALQSALFAVGVSPGDEVIVPGLSFIATAGAVLALGAKPIFAEIHPKYYTIDPQSVATLISPKTRAIISVSLFGQVGLAEELLALSQERDIPIIEDGAQSFGSTYRNQKSGSIFLIGTTSFFPTKILGGLGEGGAVFTNERVIQEKVRAYLSHGSLQRGGLYVQRGINGRMSELQAGLLRVKLQRIDEEIACRQAIAHRYDQILSINQPQISPHVTSVYAQYCLESSHRGLIRTGLQEMGIPTEIYYQNPLYSHPIFVNQSPPHRPITESVCAKIFSIPLHAYMTAQEVDTVCTQLKTVMQRDMRI